MESNKKDSSKQVNFLPVRVKSMPMSRSTDDQVSCSCASQPRRHSNDGIATAAPTGKAGSTSTSMRRIRRSFPPRRHSNDRGGSGTSAAEESTLSSDELLKVAAMRSHEDSTTFTQPPSLARRCVSEGTPSTCLLPGAYSESPGVAACRRPFARRNTLTAATVVASVQEALPAELVLAPEEDASRKLQAMEDQLQEMIRSSSCSAESAKLPEARPIPSTEESQSPELIQRMAQLEQEMKRLQQELVMSSSSNSKEETSTTTADDDATVDTTDQLEEVALLQAFRAAVKVKNRTYHFQKYKQCFVGEQAVDVLVQLTGKSRTEALVMGINLGVKHNLFEHVCDAKAHPVLKDEYLFYRFLD